VKSRGLRFRLQIPIPWFKGNEPDPALNDIRFQHRFLCRSSNRKLQCGMLRDVKQKAKFRRQLLAWFVRNRRDLPWRLDPKPYHVWISEIMLQQTRVSAVIPYYRKFLEHFPDIPSLAAASEEEVLAQWAGLGYYSRARNLLRAARIVLSRYQGVFPERIEEIGQLPGIGRYTAGAICSIAFNRPEPIVDGNVRRVLGRISGFRKPRPDSFFWSMASELVAPHRASEFNQALMEIGALICTPSDPKCNECPIFGLCRARGAKGMGKQGKKPGEIVEIVVLVVSRNGKTMICREIPVSFIPGSWFFPTGIVQNGRSAEEVAARLAGSRNGLVHAGRIRHAITSRRIVAQIFLTRGYVRIAGSRWVDENRMGEYVTSSLFIKAYKQSKVPAGRRDLLVTAAAPVD
jgi:A/G-specific adenine glycosylase